MESSISAVTYKGSIPEAILESKKQKKLFVVYISGTLPFLLVHCFYGIMLILLKIFPRITSTVGFVRPTNGSLNC
jgi:hypothetical protein